MKRFLAIFAAVILTTFAVSAQDKQCAKDGQCCQDSVCCGKCCQDSVCCGKCFHPGWYVGVQAGAVYTSSNEWGYAGWDKLKHLNLPNLAVFAGYDFTPVFGVRGSLSGPFGNYPGPEHMSIHRFGYVQLAGDAMFDICNMFRYNPTRVVNPYVFAGLGANLRFAVEGKKAFFGPLFRLGGGLDFRLNELVSLSLELQDNMLHNKFNTLTAADKGTDHYTEYHGDDGLYYGGEVLKIKKPFRWDDNVAALVGVKVNLGPARKRASAHAAEVAAAQEAARLAAEEAAARAAARTSVEYIYFDISKTDIRESEQAKVDHLISILKEFPEAVVTINGYADKATGNADINMKLSEGRANTIAKALQDAGVAADRITIAFFGDTVAVSESPEKNRVCVCVTK